MSTREGFVRIFLYDSGLLGTKTESPQVITGWRGKGGTGRPSSSSPSSPSLNLPGLSLEILNPGVSLRFYIGVTSPFSSRQHDTTL